VSSVASDESLIEALEQYTQLVELLTGIKKSMLDRGWSEYNAEVAALQFMFARHTHKQP
jgi:hypothetical protein